MISPVIPVEANVRTKTSSTSFAKKFKRISSLSKLHFFLGLFRQLFCYFSIIRNIPLILHFFTKILAMVSGVWAVSPAWITEKSFMSIQSEQHRQLAGKPAIMPKAF
jgi:hypothetical protein